ncbi:uncharacterized protein LOC142640233 [Castanea sativa]|uniref:uncharacterized protein LOC142640233 n=1 Tax=Castanea sativa TaxID=21020 RepID=UPI003F651948
MASSDQASAIITIDESHPFFLHHAENPAILVSQSLIGGENYPTWAKSMERALRIKNKFWLIDGSASLTSSMEKNPLVATSMVYCKIVKEVLEEAPNMFSRGNGPRVYQLLKDLASFSQGELSVTEYFTNLSILWDEL